MTSSFYNFWYFFLEREHLLMLTFSRGGFWFWWTEYFICFSFLFSTEKKITKNYNLRKNLNQLKTASCPSPVWAQSSSVMRQRVGEEVLPYSHRGSAPIKIWYHCWELHRGSAPLHTEGLFLTWRLICHVLHSTFWTPKTERKGKM